MASRIKPDDSEIIYNMALIKFADRDTSGGIDLINKCIALNPNKAKYYRAIAKAYYDIAKKDGVISEIRKAYNVDNNDVVTLNNAGCYYMTIGNDIDRGLYNLKCAYEMTTANIDVDIRNTIMENYESAKKIKKSLDVNSNYGVNPLLFEMLY